VNSSSRTSCHDLFKEVQILTVYSQYIYSLLMCVIKIRYLFKSSFDVHSLSTRYNSDLHLPTANLTIFPKGVFYSELKCTIVSHSLSESYHMMLDGSDWLWKEFSSKHLYSLEEYLSCKSYDWLRFLLRCNFLIFYPVLSSQFKHGCCYMLQYHVVLIILTCIRVLRGLQ
jgi:hypothetical protein